MKLNELLTELRQNILHDRSDRVEGLSDRLWSDETLLRYIDEAQRKFCREGLILRTTRTVTLLTGVATYALDENVLAVISAKHTTDEADLMRVGHHDLNIYIPNYMPYFDPTAYRGMPDGKPLAYSTDEYLQAGATPSERSLGRSTLRVYPKPTAAYNNTTLTLRIIGQPTRRLFECKPHDVPELPEDYHLDMLDWAAHLALRINDVDAGFRQASADFAATFNAKVREARRQTMRKLFAPQGHGFGQNGWSWER